MNQVTTKAASSKPVMKAVKSSRASKAPKADTKSRALKVNRIEIFEDELLDVPHEEINYLDKTRDKIAIARDFDIENPLVVESDLKDEMKV